MVVRPSTYNTARHHIIPTKRVRKWDFSKCVTRKRGHRFYVARVRPSSFRVTLQGATRDGKAFTPKSQQYLVIIIYFIILAYTYPFFHVWVSVLILNVFCYIKNNFFLLHLYNNWLAFKCHYSTKKNPISIFF